MIQSTAPRKWQWLRKGETQPGPPAAAGGEETAARQAREGGAQEAEVAFLYDALVEDQLGRLEDEGAERAVARIAGKLAAAAPRGHARPLRVRIVIDPTPNVFSGPGGSLYVTTGLLDLAGSEDELAAAL